MVRLSGPSIVQQKSICSQCRRQLLGGVSRSAGAEKRVRPVVSFTWHRDQSTWAAAINAAQNFLSNGRGIRSEKRRLAGPLNIDPFKTVAKEMKFLSGNIQQLIGSGHPMLDTVAKYYSQSEGKHIRPMLVVLISQATASLSQRSRSELYKEQEQRQKQSPRDPDTQSSSSLIDAPISPSSILSDDNPSWNTDNITTTFTASSENVLPSQTRLAEITELIHTASLLHDDVLDTSNTRRGNPSANVAFGNKMAVLAGDFLLGRASVALARLRHPEVTELLATVIANLIEGEFLQLKNTADDSPSPRFENETTIPYYLRKTYLKSASLISKSCRAAALLGECPPAVVDAAYQYGKNLGLAFQLVDDLLDFTANDAAQLGKPAGADLELGLATAPLLFAWRTQPELGALVGRRFREAGDVDRARELVRASDGVEQTRALAQSFADQAEEAVADWPEGEAKDGLLGMCEKVMQRRK